MKYCLKWNNFCSRLQDADEISIKYIEDKGLVDFMKKYSNKRFVLRLEEEALSDSEIAKLHAIHKQYPDLPFTVALKEDNPLFINKLKEKNISFYFLQPVQNWEVLNYYVKELGVSDINLSGALAFELPKVKRFLEKCNLNTLIRITPNIATSITPYCNPLQSFFIRPEDISTYEPYIDVLEFEGIENQDIFYNIYAKERFFIGKINQVIYNFSLPIDNMTLLTHFGEKRLNCKRECLKGGRCKSCFTLVEVSKKINHRLKEKIKEKMLEKSNEI